MIYKLPCYQALPLFGNKRKSRKLTPSVKLSPQMMCRVEGEYVRGIDQWAIGNRQWAKK